MESNLQTLNLEVAEEAIESLECHPKNPRRGDIRAITDSIRQNGFYGYVIVQRSTRRVLAGNHRLLAARQLGFSTIPVAWIDCDDALAERILLADNRIAELATWNRQGLCELLETLSETEQGLSGTGFNPEDLTTLLEGLGRPEQISPDPDAIPETPEEPVTQLGDLWLLGNQRLLCGDSTNPEDVQRLMEGERAALFSTDPPYLVDYDGKNHPQSWNAPKAKKRRANKDWSGTYAVAWDDSHQGEAFYQNFISAACAHAIREDAAWYCWHASRNQAMLERVWEEHGAFVHCQIIWAKDRPVLTRSWYMWAHEPCFFGWKRGKKPARVSEDFPSTVWNHPTVAPGTSTEHPTSKPTILFEIPMLQHTRAGEVCYEPFAGSGSQLIAAEKLGRRCYALEISSQYCDVIVRRWEAFTGKKARKQDVTRKIA